MRINFKKILKHNLMIYGGDVFIPDKTLAAHQLAEYLSKSNTGKAIYVLDGHTDKITKY